MTAKDELTIGEVARLAGIQTSTLRYYESIGLLPRPKRSSGQRRYGRDVLQMLAVIRLAKEANFSLPEIHALLHGEAGITDHLAPSERWRALADQKLREINAVIARAMEMKQLLEEGLECDALQFELDMCEPLVQKELEINLDIDREHAKPERKISA